MMHGQGMPPDMPPNEMKYRDWLHTKDIELGEALSRMEKELSAARKKKKQLQNKQKNVSTPH